MRGWDGAVQKPLQAAQICPAIHRGPESHGSVSAALSHRTKPAKKLPLGWHGAFWSQKPLV